MRLILVLSSGLPLRLLTFLLLFNLPIVSSSYAASPASWTLMANSNSLIEEEAAENQLLLDQVAQQTPARYIKLSNYQDKPTYEGNSQSESEIRRKRKRKSESESEIEMESQSESEKHGLGSASRRRRKQLLCSSLCSPKLLYYSNQTHKQQVGTGTGAGAGTTTANIKSISRAICASDGNLYGSICELKRQSCIQNVRLIQRPLAHCARAKARKQQQQRRVSSSLRRERQIILLDTFQCEKNHYQQMKVKLAHNFHNSITTLFHHLDSNSDQRLEAHELWPRVEGAKNKHLSSRKSPLYRLLKVGKEQENDSSVGLKSFDFAFQPLYPPNPCSLSHLILFELEAANKTDSSEAAHFNLESFREIFRDVVDPESESLISRHSSESEISLQLGEDVTLSCEPAIASLSRSKLRSANTRCWWSRYQINLIDSSLDKHHLSLSAQASNLIEKQLDLNIKDAQLYHSGLYKCSCSSSSSSSSSSLSLDAFLSSSSRVEDGELSEHLYKLQVSVAPRVHVRPRSQWSLPNSRVSFECNYDYIDTSFPSNDTKLSSLSTRISSSKEKSASREHIKQQQPPLQFGLQISWLFKRDNRERSSFEGEAAQIGSNGSQVESDWRRAFFSMAFSRLTLNQLELKDSGELICKVELTPELMGESSASLLVQEKPSNRAREESEHNLWMFHENGVSIYKVQNCVDELELVREISGHSLISSSIDGNWNQLTLCGGLNSEQVVICEWSDNALHIEEQIQPFPATHDRRRLNKMTRKYIYVGQPNLNRMLVMDGEKLEIVAIINTEPQPRKLYLYKPNKIHLSKWVKRRLSPKANAFSMLAPATSTFTNSASSPSLQSTPSKSSRSQLQSQQQPQQQRQQRQQEEEQDEENRGFIDDADVDADASRGKVESGWTENSSSSSSSSRLIRAAAAAAEQANQQATEKDLHSQPALIQHDIWLLCYGQPLVVDPAVGGSGDEQIDSLTESNSSSPFTIHYSLQNQDSTPMENNNKESKLRNRKSVHIVQSTFLPHLYTSHQHPHHYHSHEHHIQEDYELEEQPVLLSSASSEEESVVSKFKRSTVLSSHHLFARSSSNSSLNSSDEENTDEDDDDDYVDDGYAKTRVDLIQDLHVPKMPLSLEGNERYKIHYAYVTHYGDRRLFRVSMDEYNYDREIDLKNCDPISNNLITTAQGLLILQCRAPISHQLTGQLVLDQLTNARIQFNPDLIAQDSYLSPDNRYLISVYANSSQQQQQQQQESNLNGKQEEDQTQAASSPLLSASRARQSIIYVQSISVLGLKLEYEIKTSSLEISECSFVWKDGYYAAILISSNRRDQKSEILSLRLIDSRLELMARVPGLISQSRHRDQLIISPELKLAAVSTNQGTFVIDLEDNRVLQTLRRVNQSPPTLLWV